MTLLFLQRVEERQRAALLSKAARQDYQDYDRAAEQRREEDRGKEQATKYTLYLC